jgi:U3 small nucleolar ribonucleoprotein component
MFSDDSRLASENNLYIWQRTDGTKAAFDSQINMLTWVEDKYGNRQEMVYNDDSTELTQVTDIASGRSLHFTYSDGHIAAINLFTEETDQGVIVSYSHDEKDLNGMAHLDNMTRKTDADGHLLSTRAYDAFDRCIENSTADDRGVAINYDDMPDSVTVTDAYGISKIYHLDEVDDKKRIVAVEGLNGCTSCTEEAVRIAYDENANVVEKEYANGRIDQYSDFDDRGNARTTIRAEGSNHQLYLTSHLKPALDC